MGVGKTTFVKYLVNEFQKQNKLKLTEVTSPTFNLLNEYDINNIRINHYDLYRIKSSKEIDNLGIFENIYDSITLIEWPQMIEKKPEEIIEFKFNYDKDYQKRSICIKGLSI